MLGKDMTGQRQPFSIIHPQFLHTLRPFNISQAQPPTTSTPLYFPNAQVFSCMSVIAYSFLFQAPLSKEILHIPSTSFPLHLSKADPLTKSSPITLLSPPQSRTQGPPSMPVTYHLLIITNSISKILRYATNPHTSLIGAGYELGLGRWIACGASGVGRVLPFPLSS